MNRTHCSLSSLSACNRLSSRRAFGSVSNSSFSVHAHPILYPSVCPASFVRVDALNAIWTQTRLCPGVVSQRVCASAPEVCTLKRNVMRKVPSSNSSNNRNANSPGNRSFFTSPCEVQRLLYAQRWHKINIHRYFPPSTGAGPVGCRQMWIMKIVREIRGVAAGESGGMNNMNRVKKKYGGFK